MSLGALIIGLVVGWLACKLAADKKIKSIEDARSLASSAIDAAVEGTSAVGSAAVSATGELAEIAADAAESAAQKAAAAVGSGAQKAADSVNAMAQKVESANKDKLDELSASLFEARQVMAEKDNEIRRIQGEIEAAKRTVGAARHQAGNHASTIAALRAEVTSLSKQLQEARDAAG